MTFEFGIADTNSRPHHIIRFEEGKAIVPNEETFKPFTIEIDTPKWDAPIVWSMVELYGHLG
jgi:hypothetical protein